MDLVLNEPTLKGLTTNKKHEGQLVGESVFMYEGIFLKYPTFTSTLKASN